MYFRYLVFALLVASLPHLTLGFKGIPLLMEAVKSMSRILKFLEEYMQYMNIDAAFLCRISSEHIEAFLDHEPDVFEVLGEEFRSQLEELSQKASDIANNSRPYLKESDPRYYEHLGKLLDRSKVLIWYPSRTTKRSLRDSPQIGSVTKRDTFNETFSDICLEGLLGAGNNTESCTASPECLDFMTKPKQIGYTIAHQVLYFQMMEKGGCLGKTPEMKIPKNLEYKLCSNILREVERNAEFKYPWKKRDLFMEQIGLCGVWGFKDFYKAEWLENILSWQRPVGCYSYTHFRHLNDSDTEAKLRVKREEKEMPGGCMSHKTTVALLAITTNIRFIAEKISGVEWPIFPKGRLLYPEKDLLFLKA